MNDNSHNISVSTPPIVDVTFRQTHSGDRCVDILVERTRLNLSVPFILELTRFILDALPGERLCEGGVINHGYVGDTIVQVTLLFYLFCSNFIYWFFFYFKKLILQLK